MIALLDRDHKRAMIKDTYLGIIRMCLEMTLTNAIGISNDSPYPNSSV